MTEDQLKELVERALSSFRGADRYLLENDLSERCIAARLMLHIHREIVNSPELSVDVEYNRKGISPKRVALPDDCFNKRDEYGGSLVVPDIIVHRRGADGPNLLVLELKKTTNPVGHDCDRRRLQAFRDQLRYRVGGLIECETRLGQDPDIAVIEWL